MNQPRPKGMGGISIGQKLFYRLKSRGARLGELGIPQGLKVWRTL